MVGSDRDQSTGRPALLAVLLVVSVWVGAPELMGGTSAQEPRRPAQADEPDADENAPRRPRVPGNRPPRNAPPIATLATADQVRFNLISFDQTPLPATYYRGNPGGDAGVVLLIHELEGSERDFEQPIPERRNVSIAQSFQEKGLAVLALGLRFSSRARPRGEGRRSDGPVARRRDPRPDDWQDMVADLQRGYQFLVDRNNWRELNLSKFVVVGLGQGANLAARWASTPNAGVASQGRPSDIAALVLISPGDDPAPINLETSCRAVANRIPILLIAGEEDEEANRVVLDVDPLVRRNRNSRVERYPSKLRGQKLLRFEPDPLDDMVQFVESTLRRQRDPWEPRYNLDPVPTRDATPVGRRAPRPDRPAPAQGQPPC